jgi:putative endonuclease
VRQYYVYILASKSHRLYIGVTRNLERRILAHRNGTFKNAFTSAYRITRLVHFETTSDVWAAISREKQLKGWLRAKKIQLIETTNPTWQELAPELTADPSLRSG